MEAAAGEPDFDVSRSTIAWIVNLVNIYLIRYPFERYSLPLGEVDQDAAARWEDTRLGLVSLVGRLRDVGMPKPSRVGWMFITMQQISVRAARPPKTRERPVCPHIPSPYSLAATSVLTNKIGS